MSCDIKIGNSNFYRKAGSWSCLLGLMAVLTCSLIWMYSLNQVNDLGRLQSLKNKGITSTLEGKPGNPHRNTAERIKANLFYENAKSKYSVAIQWSRIGLFIGAALMVIGVFVYCRRWK